MKASDVVRTSGFVRLLAQEDLDGHPEMNRMGVPLTISFARNDDERLVLIVTFSREHRAAAESWIRGLKLDNPAVAWVRMPVIDDPGVPAMRLQAEGRILARYASASERENLLPLVTNRALFVDATGLPDTRQAHVLVINRSGEVLARVAGAYDEEKAAIVRGTVSLQEL